MRKRSNQLKGSDITVTHNKTHNGVEVRFPSKPSDSDISFLKSKGFRWSSRNHLWYAGYSERLFNLMQEHFSNALQSEPEPKPIPVVLTTEQKAVRAKEQYERYLFGDEAANARFNIIPDDTEKIKFGIAVKGYDAFISDPPKKLRLNEAVLEFDAKKGEYWHLPIKRKRPDWYSLRVAFGILLRNILSKGGNPGLLPMIRFYRSERSVYDYSSFKYFIDQNPQLTLDPDYTKIAQYYYDLEQYQKAEDARWQNWYDTNIKKGDIVYIKNKGVWESRTISGRGYALSNYPKSIVELTTQGGYIIFVGTYNIVNVFNAPDGKNLLELYPDVTPNPYTEPNFDDYMKNNIQNNIDLFALEFEALELELKLLNDKSLSGVSKELTYRVGNIEIAGIETGYFINEYDKKVKLPSKGFLTDNVYVTDKKYGQIENGKDIKTKDLLELYNVVLKKHKVIYYFFPMPLPVVMINHVFANKKQISFNHAIRGGVEFWIIKP